MRSTAVLGALLIALTATTGDARADETEWYGHQTLATDALALGLALTTGKTTEKLGVVSFGVYLVGAPIVHVARGNYGRAATSLCAWACHSPVEFSGLPGVAGAWRRSGAARSAWFSESPRR